MLCSRLRCCVTCWGSYLSRTWFTSSLTCCSVLVMGTSTSERYEHSSRLTLHHNQLLFGLPLFNFVKLHWVAPPTVTSHWYVLHHDFMCVRLQMTVPRPWWGIWALTGWSWCCRLCWWLWRRSHGEPKQVPLLTPYYPYWYYHMNM